MQGYLCSCEGYDEQGETRPISQQKHEGPPNVPRVGLHKDCEDFLVLHNEHTRVVVIESHKSVAHWGRTLNEKSNYIWRRERPSSSHSPSKHDRPRLDYICQNHPTENYQ